MTTKKQAKHNAIHTPIGLFISGLLLYATSYILFSLALGSGSYWQWMLMFVALVWGSKRIMRGLQVVTRRF